MTDVFDRGIPWTRMMLRSGTMTTTLNVTPIQRLSVGLVGLTLLALLTAAILPPMVIAAVALVLTVTLLNLDLYRFYFKQRGLWFTLRVIPMHWVYFLLRFKRSRTHVYFIYSSKTGQSLRLFQLTDAVRMSRRVDEAFEWLTKPRARACRRGSGAEQCVQA